ncbi:MAG: ABC transporter substrate-binding protein [Burkholderiaceae bacterium]|jgi:ABC-type branched-subunit amino acid transport system substrate-binding protein|nr:ABC transporter substrate-binding protein [Burkholderiaceae bacterium]
MPTATPPSALPTRRHLLQATAAAALGAPALVRAQSEPWRIGQTAALTGPLAFPFVEMNKGIAAAFKEVNDRGGIDGRPVEFFSMDDGGAPEKAAENTLKLLQKDQVFSLFACGGTTSVMGALKVLGEAKVPLIAPATGSDALRPYNPLVFHTRASYAQELNKIVRQLGSTGFTKCAVAYFDNPFGKATLAAFEAAAREHNNTQWKPFLITETPEGIAKGIEEIVQWQPYSLISLAIGASGIPFYKGLRQRTKAPAFSISFLGSRPLMTALGEASIGITVAQVVPNPANPAIPVVRAYQNAIKKMGDIEIGYSSLEGYVNARILIEALRRAGRSATREKLAEAMHSMRPYDLGGFEVRYGPNDHSGTDFVELTYFNGERFRR